MTNTINPYEYFVRNDADMEKMQEAFMRLGLFTLPLGDNFEKIEWKTFSPKKHKETFFIEELKEAFFCHNDNDYKMTKMEREIRQKSWESFKRYLKSRKKKGAENE